MQTTSNYNLNKPDLTDNANIQVINTNMDTIDTELKVLSNSISDLIYPTATGTGTTITLTLPTLVNGYAKTFIASANNNGNATTINGKPLYKPGTTTAPTLIAMKAYTIWYNSTNNCFFLKASATGTVTSEKVLAGETYSTEVDTDLIGTMPNNGTLVGSLNCGKSYIISSGYTSGGEITANSLASQTVASATADKILYGITAWVKGVKVTGNISSKGATTYTPSTTDQTISAGQYLSGSQTILGDADLISSNIVTGKSIFGVVGSAIVGYAGYQGAFVNYVSGTRYKVDFSTFYNPNYNLYLIANAQHHGFGILAVTSDGTCYYRRCSVLTSDGTNSVQTFTTTGTFDIAWNSSSDASVTTWNYVALRVPMWAIPGFS